MCWAVGRRDPAGELCVGSPCIQLPICPRGSAKYLVRWMIVRFIWCIRLSREVLLILRRWFPAIAFPNKKTSLIPPGDPDRACSGKKARNPSIWTSHKDAWAERRKRPAAADFCAESLGVGVSAMFRWRACGHHRVPWFLGGLGWGTPTTIGCPRLWHVFLVGFSICARRPIYFFMTFLFFFLVVVLRVIITTWQLDLQLCVLARDELPHHCFPSPHTLRPLAPPPARSGSLSPSLVLISYCLWSFDGGQEVRVGNPSPKGIYPPRNTTTNTPRQSPAAWN